MATPRTAGSEAERQQLQRRLAHVEARLSNLEQSSLENELKTMRESHELAKQRLAKLEAEEVELAPRMEEMAESRRRFEEAEIEEKAKEKSRRLEAQKAQKVRRGRDGREGERKIS